MIGAELFFFYGLKEPLQSNWRYITYTIYTAGLAWSIWTASGQTSRFKELFSTGFRTFIIVVLLMVAYTFVFIKMNPGIIDKIIEDNNRLIQAEGNHTPAEISANADKIRSMYLPALVMAAIFIYLALGALVSVVAAALFGSRNKA